MIQHEGPERESTLQEQHSAPVLRNARDGRTMDVSRIGRHDNRPGRRPPREALRRHLWAHLERWWRERRPDASRAEVAAALRDLAAHVERSSTADGSEAE